MELSAFLAFLFVRAAQAATPGPSTVFIVNNAVAYGWRRALAALNGDLVAIALLATLSIIGSGALLMTHPVAFLALRLAGASYILWLGWTFLRPAPPQTDPAAMEAAHGRCCKTLPFEDSHRESMRLDGLHEQTHTPDLQDQELASLQ